MVLTPVSDKIEKWWKSRFRAVLRRFWPPFVRGLCVTSGELCACNVTYELYSVSWALFQLKTVVLTPISDLVKITQMVGITLYRRFEASLAPVCQDLCVSSVEFVHFQCDVRTISCLLGTFSAEYHGF